MSAQRTDRRVRRTRDLLRSAFVSLVHEKGYDRITVQDILDRADVGRSTFYAHYRDKEDLLRSGFEDVHAALAAERAAAEREAGRETPFLQPLLAVFQHVGAYRQSWGPTSRTGGHALIARILQEGIDDLVRAHFRAQFPAADPNQLEIDAAMRFVSSACMGVLMWWLDQDVAWSAEEVHATFRRLATQGVKRFVATA
ncbi:MAG TPA: TetR/AcrR family transcriptional regulator [Acidimicrobiales bacterium]|nr:TetR/AcrR family transcriptional regulator [Acidimicrobiales bacterium]